MDGNIDLVCFMDGYHPVYSKIDSRVNRVTYFNYFGFTFIPLWFLIDTLTRANREFPEEFVIYMDKK